MLTLTYKGEVYSVYDNQSVLDGLLSHGVEIQNSCRSGICQSCLLRTDDPIDPIAQKGLKEFQKKSGIFYSCQQMITQDMKLLECHETNTNSTGIIIEREYLSSSVAQIKIDISDSVFEYVAGQFINLVREDGFCRSYSIANTTGSDVIELHIRKIPGGVMSGWLYDDDVIGQRVTLNGPVGECYYQEDYRDQELLLIGTGTGLAPLCGILKDALAKNHSLSITLYHGALNSDGLYYVDQLKALQKQYSNFNYRPTIFKGDSKCYQVGNIVDVVRGHDLIPQQTVTFICGDPDIVKALKEAVFLKGVSFKKIFSDPFVQVKESCLT